MIGKVFFAPIDIANLVEGEVTHYVQETGRVTLRTIDGEEWVGFEHQLEPIGVQPEESSERIKWTGENQLEISEFLGNENFWHKAGTLFIERAGEPLVVNKGELLFKTMLGGNYKLEKC